MSLPPLKSRPQKRLQARPSTRPEILPYGDGAFLVQFQTQHYDPNVTDRIETLKVALQKSNDWVEIVTGYNALLVSFNPQNISPDTAVKHLENTLRTPKKPLKTGRVIDVPVCYGGHFGPDIDAISQSSGLSTDAIIALHSQETYQVCMMGFIPGFTFLSEAPKALHHPRHATPRLSVPAGSVGLAGWQTGIYGLESPGGWQIIGRTPSRIFDSTRAEPFLIKSGDSVKFTPVSEADYLKLDNEAIASC